MTKNAWQRYVTIDGCLRNTHHQWTLDELTRKCSHVNQELTGQGISRRTIQNDIQFMRGVSPGFNAPIVVRKRKYYVYADPEFNLVEAMMQSIGEL